MAGRGEYAGGSPGIWAGRGAPGGELAVWFHRGQADASGAAVGNGGPTHWGLHWQPWRIVGQGAGERGRYLVGADAPSGGIVHTPGEVEDEIDRIHTEFMQTGNEIIQQGYMPVKDAIPVYKQRGANDAQIAEATKGLKMDDPSHEPKANLPLAMRTFLSATWEPFRTSWITWRSAVKDIPMQLLPGSGAWDHAQEFRQQIDTLRTAAKAVGFKFTSPDPTPPKFDPSIMGEVGKILKYAAWGALGLGAVFAGVMIYNSARK